MDTIKEWIEAAPWRDRAMLIIDIKNSEQAWDLSGKRALVAREDGPLLAVWNGKWHAGARVFGEGDREKVAEILA